MKYDFDVDIDFADRESLLRVTNCIRAKNADKVHGTGVYFQDIPFDPRTGVANVDFGDAKEFGYFKVDVLSASVYDGIRNEAELLRLMDVEPMWSLLEHPEFVRELFHISEYGWLTKRLKPTSVEELAMILAVIRPSKKHLRDKEWPEIRDEVWVKPTDGAYYFKKAHAISYAVAIVVQMNKIVERISLGV